MPLTKKGNKIMANMESEYGPEAKRVFYASANKGTIKGVHKTKKRHGGAVHVGKAAGGPVRRRGDR